MTRLLLIALASGASTLQVSAAGFAFGFAATLRAQPLLDRLGVPTEGVEFAGLAGIVGVVLAAVLGLILPAGATWLLTQEAATFGAALIGSVLTLALLAVLFR